MKGVITKLGEELNEAGTAKLLSVLFLNKQFCVGSILQTMMMMMSLVWLLAKPNWNQQKGEQDEIKRKMNCKKCDNNKVLKDGI